VDVRLDEVVLRSMERDVERRYQHVSEVKTAVEGVMGAPHVGVPTSVGTGQTPPKGGTPTGTNWAKIVLIVVGCLVAIPVIIGLLVFARLWMRPVSSRPVTTLKAFTAADRTIATNLVAQDGGWFANCPGPRTIPLFEVAHPGVEDGTVTYRAQLKAEGLKGRAYLEMWCRLPGRGEFFSKGLDKIVTGSTDWTTYEIPFFLKKGEQPDLLRLNLVVEGVGRVGIRNVELRTNAKQLPAAPTPLPVSASQARPALSADQMRVEDTAIRLLAAMRDKEDKVMQELATGSIIKAWPDVLPQFAFELRERYQHEFGKPLALWPVESLVDGDFAVVRCTSKETEANLNDWCLGLIFYKMKDGTWRNAALAGARTDMSLAAFLANFKAQNMPAPPKQNTDALRAQAEQLLQQGKYDEVITAVSKAIEQDPQNPLPWYRRATARALKGETANALADLKKAIELDPNLKSRATSDAFFKSLQDNAEFKSLTQ
jgi:hypothetical protein